MKFSQRLEICTGIATPIATLLYIYFGFVRITLQSEHFRSGNFKQEGFNSGEIGAAILFTILFLFSLMVALGAYQDAKGNDMGTDVLYVSSSVVIVF